MKKIVGIVTGLIILAIIICGIFFGKDYIANNGPEPPKELIDQTYEDFLNKMESADDEDMYNNFYTKELRDRFSLEDISLLNSHLRGYGKIENIDKNSIEYSKEKKDLYVVSSKVEIGGVNKIVEIKIKCKNGECKINDYLYSDYIEE